MANELLAKNLKTIRGLFGINQKQFAFMVGLPPTTYAHQEQGNSDPSIGTVKVLTDLTGLTINDLIGKDLAEKDPTELLRLFLTTVSGFVPPQNKVET